jgi:hypothetical protein
LLHKTSAADAFSSFQTDTIGLAMLVELALTTRNLESSEIMNVFFLNFQATCTADLREIWRVVASYAIQAPRISA